MTRREQSGSRWGMVAAVGVLCGALGWVAQAAAGGADDGAAPQPLVCHAVQFSEADLTFERVDGHDVVRLAGASSLRDVGQPMLPALQLRFALPPGMAASDVRVLQLESQTLAGQYDIMPSQLPAAFDADEPPAFVAPDPVTYASAAPYPPTPVVLARQTDLAGQPIAVVELHPLAYTPRTGELTLYTQIEFAIDGGSGYVCQVPLSRNASPATVASYSRLVAGLVVNPADVTLAYGTSQSARAELPPGAYDYVIITPFHDPNGARPFQPLADWKTRKGVPTSIVSTSWIYTTYGGGGDPNYAQIRAFIVDAQAQWGARYFLLGGDTDQVPVHYRFSAPNDTYYSDLDNNWTCDVHVGRASVTSAAEAATFVSKVLVYEQRPPVSNYALTAALLGFDLHELGSGEGENCKIAIDTLYIPDNWTVNTVYDSQAVPPSHKSRTLGFLNAGQHLVNHIDHSEPYGMGLGYLNHGGASAKLLCPEVDALTNGDRRSIVYSCGCSPAAFDEPICIAEHFLRAGGAGIAFVGNTRSGHYYPHDPDALSLHYDQCFFRSLFQQDVYHLGECFSDHKNEGYVDIHDQYEFNELTLLGDPEMPIWTANPAALTVRHPVALPVGTSTFRVVVGGVTPGAGRTVCLWKGAEVYAEQTTDPNGLAAFTVSPATPGVLYVTVTGRNALPYRGSAMVRAETWDVLPEWLTVEVGTWVLGELEDIYYSDDESVKLWPGLAGEKIPPTKVIVHVVGIAPTLTPLELSFTLEARVNRDATLQTIRMYNFSKSAYEEVDVRTATQSDTSVTVTPFGKLSQFVCPDTNEVQTQITWKMSTTEPEGLVVSIDQAVWGGT